FSSMKLQEVGRNFVNDLAHIIGVWIHEQSHYTDKGGNLRADRLRLLNTDRTPTFREEDHADRVGTGTHRVTDVFLPSKTTQLDSGAHLHTAISLQIENCQRNRAAGSLALVSGADPEGGLPKASAGSPPPNMDDGSPKLSEP